MTNSVLAVATTFTGSWTNISIFDREGGPYTRDKNTYAGT